MLLLQDVLLDLVEKNVLGLLAFFSDDLYRVLETSKIACLIDLDLQVLAFSYDHSNH